MNCQCNGSSNWIAPSFPSRRYGFTVPELAPVDAMGAKGGTDDAYDAVFAVQQLSSQELSGLFYGAHPTQALPLLDVVGQASPQRLDAGFLQTSQPESA